MTLNFTRTVSLNLIEAFSVFKVSGVFEGIFRIYFNFISDATMIHNRTSLPVKCFSTFGNVRNNSMTSQHDQPDQGVVRLLPLAYVKIPIVHSWIWHFLIFFQVSHIERSWSWVYFLIHSCHCGLSWNTDRIWPLMQSFRIFPDVF